MDETQRILANESLFVLQEKPKLLAAAVTEFVYHKVNTPEAKKILNYDDIFKYLESLSLIEIEYGSEGRKRPQVLKITSIGQRHNTIEEREQEIRFQEYNEEKKKKQKEADEEVKRQLDKRQLWLAKYWWLTSGASLIAGAIIQKIFKVL